MCRDPWRRTTRARTRTLLETRRSAGDLGKHRLLETYSKPADHAPGASAWTPVPEYAAGMQLNPDDWEPVEDEERTEWVYVTNTQPQQVVRVDAPLGLIMPPTIDLHRPMVGPVTFYHADGYGIPVAP